MAINDVPVWYFENSDLILFIAKQSKNIVTPFRIRSLCADFKSIKKTCLSVLCLCRRIERFRHKLHELTNLDIITRMKMLFALSAPVDKHFLVELSKEAVVEVDEQNRIVSFESKDLKLKGKHFSSLNRDKLNKDKQILHFLFEFSKTIDSPVSGSSFVRSYAKATSSTAGTYLRDRYVALTSQIHSCTAYDAASRAKMMFVSSTAVCEDFLKELRKDAIVEIDEENRITHYKANDGTKQFKGSHRRQWPKKSCATVKAKVPIVMRNIGHPVAAICSNKPSLDVQTVDSSATVNITGGRKLAIQDAPSINSSSTMNDLVRRKIKTDVVEKDQHEDNTKSSKRRTPNADAEKEQKRPIKRCRKLTKSSEENVPETDTKHTPDLSSSVSYEHLRRAIFENVDEMPETQRTIATRHKIKKDKIEEVNALKVLSDVVNTLNSPRLAKVHKLILKRGRDQRNIVNHTSEVNMGLRTAFLALIKNAKPYKVSEKFVSLRKVLVLLCCNLINMNCPSLSGFQKEITTTIRDLRTVDKSISFKTLSMILKTVVLALSSREDEDE